MDDLLVRVRELVERSTEPVAPEEVVARAHGRGDRSRRVMVGALVVFVLVLGAVSIGVLRDEAQVESPTGVTSRDDSTSFPEGCTGVIGSSSAELVSVLDEGLSFGFVARYPSGDERYQGLMFLSAEIGGPGMEGTGDIATWASNGAGLASQLSVVPVNELASSVSTGVGEAFEPMPTMETDGAVESQQCLAPRPVPDLAGIDQETGAGLLAESGVETVFVEEAHPTAAPGEVLRTDPPAGTLVEPGSTVTLVVSGVEGARVLRGRIVEGVDAPLPVSLSASTFRLSDTARSYTWVSEPVDPARQDVGLTIEAGPDGDATIDRQGFETLGGDRVYVVEFTASGEEGARGWIVVGDGVSASGP